MRLVKPPGFLGKDDTFPRGVEEGGGDFSSPSSPGSPLVPVISDGEKVLFFLSVMCQEGDAFDLGSFVPGPVQTSFNFARPTFSGTNQGFLVITKRL